LGIFSPAIYNKVTFCPFAQFNYFSEMKVLMVCLGNICRSPMAQGILEHKVKEKGLAWTVDSAGTTGGHAGLSPDSRAMEVAHTHGIDISAQECRRIRYADITGFDIIYCMDSSNLVNVRDLCHTLEEEARVKLIMDECDPGKKISVPDPYYGGGTTGFENVYQMLDRACDAIIEKHRDKRF
jgi:protein-tyrosine phosphatase